MPTGIFHPSLGLRVFLDFSTNTWLISMLFEICQIVEKLFSITRHTIRPDLTKWVVSRIFKYQSLLFITWLPDPKNLHQIIFKIVYHTTLLHGYLWKYYFANSHKYEVRDCLILRKWPLQFKKAICTLFEKNTELIWLKLNKWNNYLFRPFFWMIDVYRYSSNILTKCQIFYQ